MVEVEIKKIVKKKKSKKSKKRKTKKRLSTERIQNIINIYLDNKDVRKRKRKEAQQKRNPLNRLGSAYPIQNKAIDAISYSNQFRNTNDTRVMAMEQGLNGLTGNMTQLTAQVRRLQAPPLTQPKPAIEPPSQNYLQRNPNYPSSLVGSSLDLEQDEIKEKIQLMEIEAQKIVDDTKSDIEDLRSGGSIAGGIEQSITETDRLVKQMELERLGRMASPPPLRVAKTESEIDDEEEGFIQQEGEIGLSVNQADNIDAEDLLTNPSVLPKVTDINQVRGADIDADSANKLIEYANMVNLDTIPYVNTEGLVKSNQVGKFKEAIRKALREKKK